MSDASHAVLIVGPLGWPPGGVSTHVKLLSEHLSRSGLRCRVLDIYAPRPLKGFQGKHETAPFLGTLRYAWLVVRLLEAEERIVHLHFSRVDGACAVLLALVALANDKRFFVTLHDGDQARHYSRRWWLHRYLIRRAFHKCAGVLALSGSQREFYRTCLSLDAIKIYREEANIPLHLDESLRTLRQRWINWRGLHRSRPVRLLIAGYAQELYRFEWALDALLEARLIRDVELCICLYGAPDNIEYQENLVSAARSYDHVRIRHHLSRDSFLKELTLSDIYLRLNSVDSYGIAVAEAVALGVLAIASDACTRANGCYIFPTENKRAFIGLLCSIVREGAFMRTRPIDAVEKKLKLPYL